MWWCSYISLPPTSTFFEVTPFTSSTSLKLWARKAKYVEQNIKARTRNQSCSGKAVNITNSKYASVALFIQHAMRMRHIILSSMVCLALPYFSTLSNKGQDIRGNAFHHQMCVLIVSVTFALSIFHSEKNWARYGQKRILVFMHSTIYISHILMKIEFSRRIFQTYSNTKNHGNLFSGSRDVPCGRTDG